MKQVVFVCFGNRCRSVAAEYLLRKMLAEKDEKLAKEVKVSSAGFVTEQGIEILKSQGFSVSLPYFGKSPYDNTKASMRKRGIDVSGYSSMGLDEGTLKRASLVITMEQDQKDGILSQYPWAKEKVFTFKEFFALESQSLRLEDAYGVLNKNIASASWEKGQAFDDEFIEETIAEIEEYLKLGAEKLFRYLSSAEGST